MLVLMCAKYGKNTFETVVAAMWTRQDVQYFSNSIGKTWSTDLGDIVKAKSHYTDYFSKYKMNLLRIVCVVERTRQGVSYFNNVMADEPCRYSSRSKVIRFTWFRVSPRFDTLVNAVEDTPGQIILAYSLLIQINHYPKEVHLKLPIYDIW